MAMTGKFSCRQELNNKAQGELLVNENADYEIVSKQEKVMKAVKSVLLFVILAAIVFIAGYKGIQYLDDKKESGIAETYTGVTITDGAFGQVIGATAEDASSLPPSEETENSQTANGKINFDSLLRINPDTVGWICIDGTEINNPVVQTTNNTKYLKTAFTGEANLVGTLFLDYRADAQDGKVLIIYGHHYKSTRKAFTDLLNYQTAEYLEEHPTVTLEFPDRGETTWQVFAVATANSKNSEDVQKFYRMEFANDVEYFNYLMDIKASSLYDTGVDVVENGRLLVLSTCAPDGVNRVLVCCQEIV